MRFLTVFAAAILSVSSVSVVLGGEAASNPVTSTIDIELHGRLKADASWDNSRTHPGNFVVWVDQEHTGSGSTNDDEFNMTANETRLWLVLKGPEVGSIQTGGRVEIDFYGSGASENKAKLMLRRAYITATWKDLGLTLLAGQHSDIISPLVASTLNYTVGWDIGNIGYRRPQVRLQESLDLGGGLGLDLAAGIFRTIGAESFPGVSLGNEYGEDSGFPTTQARIGIRLPGFGPKPISFGVSGHYGQEQFDVWNKDISTYSVNLDAKVPVRLDQKIGDCPLNFELSGELFYGKNLNSYFGGISQGVNPNTHDAITSNGGWGQVAFLGVKNWRFVVGGGVDNPYSRQVPAGGRLQNKFVFANAVHNLTRRLQVGVEYSYYKTLYNGPDGTDHRLQFSMIYHF